MIVAVDDIETRRNELDTRPYALANPQFKTMPVFGQFCGQDNPEQILSLSPQPQLIFKVFGGTGYDPDELQTKTGIPVVVVGGGDLVQRRQHFQRSLRLMGEIIGKKERADAVVAFFEQTIEDLQSRTADIPEDQSPFVYLGGMTFKGPHGFQSTEANYPPFVFLSARNLAHTGAGKKMTNSEMAKEQILAW